jgi:GTP-binding protein LepA
VFDGKIAVGDKVRMMNSGAEYEVVEVGTLSTSP